MLVLRKLGGRVARKLPLATVGNGSKSDIASSIRLQLAQPKTRAKASADT